MLIPSPSSSCRIRWILDLSLNAVDAHSRNLNVLRSFDSAHLPLTPSLVGSGDWAEVTGGDSIIGGWLDGLTTEFEESTRESKKPWRYISEYGGFEDATRTDFTSSSEQKLRWSVEVRRPSVESEWQQHATKA